MTPVEEAGQNQPALHLQRCPRGIIASGAGRAWLLQTEQPQDGARGVGLVIVRWAESGRERKRAMERTEDWRPEASSGRNPDERKRPGLQGRRGERSARDGKAVKGGGRGVRKVGVEVGAA